MFSVLLAVGLLTGILCGPLPKPDERLGAVEPTSDPVPNTTEDLNPTPEVGSGTADEETLEAQETFYPMGGVWWGIRPWGGWGGWGGYRPWHGPHWGGHWGGPWGGHWGGHWGGGRWRRGAA